MQRKEARCDPHAAGVGAGGVDAVQALQPKEVGQVMPWIESHTSLARHPKTLRLARILGIAVPAALGHLHLLWWWAIEYAPDGDVGRFDAGDLALACMWEGDETALLPALQRAGFVDQDGNLHDWHDYAGKLVDRRRRNAERMREDRAAHVADAPSINSDACEARAAHVQSEPDARVKLQNSTYRTVPNQPNLTNTTGPDPTDRVAPDADAPDAFAPTIAPSDAPLSIIEPVPKPRQRPEDPIFQAFLDIFADGEDGLLTEAERAKWNAAAKGFRNLATNKQRSPLEMAALIREAHEHWPNVKGDLPETPNGLLSNFATLLRGPQVNGRSNGTVTAHTQRLTETALVPHQATVADIRRRRKANDEPGR
jgi:hypothetical protein